MIGLNQISPATRHARCASASQELTHRSSLRENVFEHMLLGQLGAELLHRGIDYDELHTRMDRNGFDVVLEALGIVRHCQFKVMISGGTRGVVTVSTRLAARPSGCVVWLTYDAVERRFSDIRWFGAAPGEPLPNLGEKVARHTRANSRGVKAERPDHRVVPASRFEKLAGIAELADRLFGPTPADQLALVRSCLQPAGGRTPRWLAEVGDGRFAAIPEDISWNDAISLAHLIDGYELLQRTDCGDPSTWLARQREAQRTTGRWPGDALQLWITLFMEARANRFGSNGFSTAAPHLDLLCQQLRAALAELGNADA